MLLDDNPALSNGNASAAAQSPPANTLGAWLEQRLGGAAPDTVDELEELVTDIGRRPWLWGDAVRFDLERRSYVTLYESPDLVIGFFGWAAGQDTVFHDHGSAIGAAYVASGMLIEDTVEAIDSVVVRERTFSRAADSSFGFGPDYVHRVRHEPALGASMSIHAYAPAVEEQTDYEVVDDGSLRLLVPTD